MGDKLYLNVHYRGICKFDHYNLNVVGGPSVKITEKSNPNVLCSSQPALYGPVERNRQYTFRISGCVDYIIGKDRCTGFSAPVSFTPGAPDKADAAKATACRNYANRAVGAAKLARDTYKCDAKVISGPRWTANFDEHFRWCVGAEPRIANFEDKERIRIMHSCRVDAAKGPPGKPALSVTSQGGDTFFVNVSGFPPNVPIIIRLSGPGASIASVTVANNQRIVADAKGAVSIRLFGAQICKRGGGQVTFTAEDQDGRKSPPATAKCAP